ncbi:MAG: hypothetical protein A2Z18_08415 [Armatimonadetes bacterium RBG_16_58_9]|nr:MAG: hypothetical protein A2Z18_08415 [Armatimonadetes bacterium RBG_16_58_9]
MKPTELLKELEELREKLHRSQRQATGLRQKSKYLEMQYGDSRERERNTNDLVMELLERQRELNVMLNRANIMINRTQEVMALTSMEFNEMAKALPEPKKAEWSDRVAKVNELFKKTGVQDAEVGGLESSNPPPVESLDSDEMEQESRRAFAKSEVIWKKTEGQDAPTITAQFVEEDQDTNVDPEGIVMDEVVVVDEETTSDQRAAESEGENDEDALMSGPRRKSWWQRMAG